MAEDKRIAIWNALERTDKQFTKDFGGAGGFKGTAINPTYVQMKLTQLFGPCGVGWKFVIEEEQYKDGHKLKSGDQCVVHVVRGHLDYLWENEWRSTGPQFGQTTFIGENKYGTFTDEEAPKKSCTDALTKACAALGMSADIFSGQWDANKYIHKPLGPLEGENTPKSPPPEKPEKPKTKAASKKAAETPAEPEKKPEPAETFEVWKERIDGKKKPEDFVVLIGKMVKHQPLLHDPIVFCKVCDYLAWRLLSGGDGFEAVLKKYVRDFGDVWKDKMDACKTPETLKGLTEKYLLELNVLKHSGAFFESVIGYLKEVLEKNPESWDVNKVSDLKDWVRVRCEELELQHQANEVFG